MDTYSPVICSIIDYIKIKKQTWFFIRASSIDFELQIDFISRLKRATPSGVVLLYHACSIFRLRDWIKWKRKPQKSKFIEKSNMIRNHTHHSSKLWSTCFIFLLDFFLYLSIWNNLATKAHRVSVFFLLWLLTLCTCSAHVCRKRSILIHYIRAVHASWIFSSSSSTNVLQPANCRAMNELFKTLATLFGQKLSDTVQTSKTCASTNRTISF